jgi:hypothetical protein
MGKLGIISGTLALQGKGIFGELTEEIVERRWFCIPPGLR